MAKEFTNCIVSGSSELVELKGYPGLVKSKPLGFVFYKQIPTIDELNAHYAKYRRNDYLSPLTIKRYEEILESFESFRKTGKLLDLGCGIGHFAQVAKSKGWEVYGTEFSDEAIAICESKGIKMKQGKTQKDMFDAESFDVITSFEVIEHINYPNEEMECVRYFLRKGGLFYCTTPNFNAIERYVLKNEYTVICYPEHLSYYTPKTFHFLMKKHGFKKKFIKSTGISISKLIKHRTVTEAAGGVAVDSPDEKLRNNLESNFLAKSAKNFVNLILTLLGVGNALKAAYIKE